MKKLKNIFIVLLVVHAIYILIKVYNNLDYNNEHVASHSTYNIAGGVSMTSGTKNGHNWGYTWQQVKTESVSRYNGRNDKFNWTYTGQHNRANGQSISSTAQLKNDDGFSLKLDRNDKYNWNYTGQLSKEYRQFAPALNMTEYTRYMDLITIFKSAIEAFNITYLLEGGQVLGSYWFHGFIPWDDDFDCKVNVSQKHILKKALTDVSGHTLHSPTNDIWKFYNNSFAKAGPHEYKWPFIDILFFADNGTHVYDATWEKPCDIDPRSDILPLENGIFENMIFPVPHNIEAYLNRRNYKMQCKTHTWNHKTESLRKPFSMSCHKLYGVYPVVHRLKLNNASFEELRLGNKVLYRVEHPGMKLSLLKPKILW